jgi:hypothetical protein
MVVNILTKNSMINNHLVYDVLIYLEDEGWSELIDKRWEPEVKTEILKKYPQIDEDTLKYVLKLVLY